jgi:hypothetical protein
MRGVTVTRLFTGSSPYNKGHYCVTGKQALCQQNTIPSMLNLVRYLVPACAVSLRPPPFATYRVVIGAPLTY